MNDWGVSTILLGGVSPCEPVGPVSQLCPKLFVIATPPFVGEDAACFALKNPARVFTSWLIRSPSQRTSDAYPIAAFDRDGKRNWLGAGGTSKLRTGDATFSDGGVAFRSLRAADVLKIAASGEL